MSGHADTIRAEFPDSTPRPWYFDGWDIFTSASSAGSRGDGHRLVVPLSHLNETFHPSQKVSEDDARLIVAAVNERDALLAENRRLREALERIAEFADMASSRDASAATENKLAVALAAREAMREHRKGRPIAFSPPPVKFWLEPGNSIPTSRRPF